MIKRLFKENVLVETFNIHYVNIFEKSCKIKPQLFSSLSSKTDDKNVKVET